MDIFSIARKAVKIIAAKENGLIDEIYDSLSERSKNVDNGKKTTIVISRNEKKNNRFENEIWCCMLKEKNDSKSCSKWIKS